MSDLATMQDVEAIGATAPVPVGSADAFLQAVQQAIPASEYTGAVPLIEDKDKLRNIPFVVMGARNNEGNTEAGYWNLRFMLPNGNQFCFNDGGSAIAPVIEAHIEAHGIADDGTLTVPMLCPRGLRRSDYSTEIDGKKVEATTYWIA